MKKETNLTIRILDEQLNILNDNLTKIISQPFWCKKVSISEKMEYLRIIASTRQILFDEVERIYPEIKGMPYSVSRKWIKWDEPL